MMRHQAAWCCAEQHSPPVVAWCSLWISGLAGQLAGVTSGNLQFCRAAQTGCSSLMQLQDFGVTRKLLGHGARCSPGCCRAAQAAICCALHNPQCSLGISGLVGRPLIGHQAAWCCSEQHRTAATCGGLVQPADFGLGMAACWGGIRQLMLLQSSSDWLQQPGAAPGIRN